MNPQQRLQASIDRVQADIDKVTEGVAKPTFELASLETGIAGTSATGVVLDQAWIEKAKDGDIDFIVRHEVMHFVVGRLPKRGDFTVTLPKDHWAALAQDKGVTRAIIDYALQPLPPLAPTSFDEVITAPTKESMAKADEIYERLMNQGKDEQ